LFCRRALTGMECPLVCILFWPLSSNAQRHSRLLPKLLEQSSKIHSVRRYKRNLLYPSQRAIEAERKSRDRRHRFSNRQIGGLSCLSRPHHHLLDDWSKLALRSSDLPLRSSL